MKSLLKQKKAMEFNFEWIFAMVAGAAILILAVYGAVKFSQTLRYQQDSELAKGLSIALDPMQAGFAEGKSSVIKFNQETRINNICDNSDFGANRISASSRSSIGEEWQNPGAETIIKNKYIFSSPESSKNYIAFSKQLVIGFRVADLLFLTSSKYCFINPPNEIEEEIRSFQIANFKINNQGCENSSINVCFRPVKGTSQKSKSCNMTIWGSCSDCETEYEQGYVEKGNRRFYYIGSLMYGAIIADYNVYNCNVQRLLYRTSKMAQLYIDKGDILSARQCSTNLKPELEVFMNVTSLASKSGRFDSAFSSIVSVARELNMKNSQEVCELW